MVIWSKIATKIMGIQDEAAKVLVATGISMVFAFFIAVRLIGADIFTICCTVAIDMFHYSKMTYRIVKGCKKITDGEINIVNTEKNTKITMLILAELIEGLTPNIYGIGMALAFYGPNSRLFPDVKNNYWSEEIEYIGPTFIIMTILFGMDTLTAFFNSICLWKLLHVNMISEFHRVLKNYGYFIAIHSSTNFAIYFASKDINYGMDQTNAFQCISSEWWINIVNKSIDLTNEEKNDLLERAKF